MKEIKHLFFTYRNGAVADTLRRYGMPYKIIFGLDIPRIAEIARGLQPSEDYCMRLASEVITQEEADMLAFRLLKRMPFANALLSRMQSDPTYGQAARALQAHIT